MPSPDGPPTRSPADRPVPGNERGGFNRQEPDRNDPTAPDPKALRAQNAIRFFRLVIAPEADYVDWETASEKERQTHCAAVLKSLLDIDYRKLAERLEEWDRVAREAGFKPGKIKTYSAFSRNFNDLFDEDDEEQIEEAAHWADNAALHASLPGGSSLDHLGPKPSPPLSYYEITDRERGVSQSGKMGMATSLVEKYMRITLPSIGFDRDTTAPNFQYPTSSFYRLLAHIALEDCYIENGAEILRWKRDDIEVPPPSTVRENARKFSVKDLEKKFSNATCQLLQREGLSPAEPVHLAFDVTKVHWYGDEGAKWTSGGLLKQNTTQFWNYAVLSVAAPGGNYILGASPIKSEKRVAAALDRMLRNVREGLDVDLGRVYMDSGLAQTDIIETCRKHDLDFMIQTENKGEEIKEFLKWARPDEVERMTGYPFGDFEKDRELVNVFAAPINPDEIGSSKRDYTHTAWFTDFEVGLDDVKHDLRGMAYQYRYRWRVETAIRQIKNDFEGRCGSADRRVRMLYSGASVLFFNFWVALRRELGHHLGDPDGLRITGLETLHAIRDADIENSHGSKWLV